MLRIEVPIGQHLNKITTPYGEIMLADGKYSTYAIIDNLQIEEFVKATMSAKCVISEIL